MKKPGVPLVVPTSKRLLESDWRDARDRLAVALDTAVTLANAAGHLAELAQLLRDTLTEIERG